MRPVPHRLDGQRDGAKSGDNDDFGRYAVFDFEPFENLQSAHLGHADIQQDQVVGIVKRQLQPACGIRRDIHGIAPARQNLTGPVPDGFFIINNEDFFTAVRFILHASSVVGFQGIVLVLR